VSYDKTYARDVLGADCDNCPLRNVGQFVPSSGSPSSAIAFVGEAPGAGEARTGEPFTGPSGRLLDIVTDQYGIKREEVFLTNATLCRAPDGQTPAASAIRACKPRLHTELEGITETVVALGNTAAESTLGVGGVTKLRVGPGRTSPYDKLGHLRIIPTVHPAACLRQSDMFPSLVADIGKVVTEHVPWSEPEYTVLDDADEAIAFLRQLEERGGDCYIDIEVDIEKDTAFDHPDRYDLLCVGLGDYQTERAYVVGYSACHDDRVLDAMADALAACNLDAQNGKFDLAGLFPKVGPLRLAFDTMLANYALDERPGIHGLKYMAVEMLGAPEYDAEIKKYVGPKDGYGAIPRDLLYKYNAYDVVAGMRIKKLQVKRLATKAPEWWGKDQYTSRYEYKSLRDAHDFMVDYGSNSLMFLELNGIKIDREYNRELHVLFADRLAPIEERIDQVLLRSGYRRINPRSPKQVKEALAALHVRVDTTNEDTLHTIIDKCNASDDPRWEPVVEFSETLLEHRRQQKLFSTYVKGPAKRLYKGRVYSTYMLHGTTSGRLASRNPNLQNIVRDKMIKKQYVPGKPENLFVQADYGQAELRTLTWLTGCEFFRDLLNDDERDFFDELTPMLYPELPSKLKTPAELWTETRIRVKAFVYGLGYGRTEFSIAHEYKMPLEEAKRVKKNFFNVIPEVVEWQEWVQEQVRAGRDLITPFGRHRRYHLITEENWNDIKKESLAFLPQSTSSDICVRAMARVRDDLRGTGCFIRNIVHDSILVDCPPDMVDFVAELLNRRMVESAYELVGDYVKFKTDVEVGRSWGELEKYRVAA
jgi:uracil-DNA glycosylase family 4